MVKILIIVAHPDDEVIGMGGTILKHSERRDEVYLLVVTDGASAKNSELEELDHAKLRREHSKEVSVFLGIKKTFFYNFPDARLDTIPQLELNRAFEELIEKISPDRIYTHHWSDLHRDHTKIFESVMVASRKTVSEVFCFEDICSTNVRRGVTTFIPNIHIDITEFVDKKLEAMSFYKSIIQEFPRPISLGTLKTLARYRGIGSGFEFAEAFVCVKSNRKEI